MKKILVTMVALAVLATFISSVPAATLTESPANIAQGGTVTATWGAIAAPTNRDWIALSTPGAVDTSYIDWLYVNTCNKSGGTTAPANGSCPFPIPDSLPNGTYELRLFTNNGYTRLATSNPFNVSPVPPPSLRFVDNGDGTITDDETGLMWEKKTDSVGSDVNCSTLAVCPDPHNVNNRYQWTSTGTAADGTLFTNFLARINTELSTSADGITVADVCFAGHCDWRIPNVAELRTLLLATCPSDLTPCIDPIFGPTQVNFHWSSTTVAGFPGFAWFAHFFNGGGVSNVVKNDNFAFRGFARAVRGAQ